MLQFPGINSQDINSHGIYILASDAQYDQLMALIHSIEVNVSTQLPICIIPASDDIGRIQRAIAQNPRLRLFTDRASLARWEQFAQDIWCSLPVVNQLSQRYARHYDAPEQFRKFCAFEGPFEKFVFFDVASLAMQPLDDCWAKLEDYDFVLDDWEHAKPASLCAFDWTILSRAEQPGALADLDLRDRLHGARFFASKRGLFGPAQLARLRHQLIDQGEVRWINALSWWSDDALFCYLTLRGDAQRPAPLFNYSLSGELSQRTGHCALGDGLVVSGQRLFCLAAAPEKPGLKPIHRVDYGHCASQDFALLCAGESVNLPFEHLFLHYRFLHQRVRRLPRRLGRPLGNGLQQRSRPVLAGGGLPIPRLKSRGRHYRGLRAQLAQRRRGRNPMSESLPAR